jgi:hypothetical protein
VIAKWRYWNLTVTSELPTTHREHCNKCDSVEDNREMAISIPSGLTDDNDFVDLLNALLNALLVQQTPEQLWVIQIDNWFDHKWLRYSGSGSVPSKFPANWTSSFMDRFTSVKEQFWRDKLTFPPFVPDRVVSQCSLSACRGRLHRGPSPEAAA